MRHASESANYKYRHLLDPGHLTWRPKPPVSKEKVSDARSKERSTSPKRLKNRDIRSKESLDARNYRTPKEAKPKPSIQRPSEQDPSSLRTERYYNKPGNYSEISDQMIKVGFCLIRPLLKTNVVKQCHGQI